MFFVTLSWAWDRKKILSLHVSAYSTPMLYHLASQRLHDDLGYESGSHVTCLSHIAGASNVKCVMWVNRERNVANFKLDNEIKKVL